MKLTLIGNGIMAQSLAIGLVKEHEVEMIGRELNKLKQIKEKIPELQIKELSDKEDISGKNVVVLEDIVDTGETLLSLKDNLSIFEPKSLRFCSLIVRESCHLNRNLFWTGFKIKNEFVVGYGLDYDGDYRNLVDIYKLNNTK